MADERNMSYNEEIKLISARNRYNNFSSILKEMRFLDKVIIVFSGTIWAFFIQYEIKDYSNIILFIPFFVSFALAIKNFYLNYEYKEQKCEYEKIINSDDSIDCKKQDFSIHWIPFIINISIVLANLIAAILLAKCR